MAKTISKTNFHFPTLIEQIIWEDKYRFKKWKEGAEESTESTIDDTLKRAVHGIYEKDPSDEALQLAEEVVCAREFCPAGRELAGAGTDKRVTLVNCYVNAVVEDSIATEARSNSLGIMEAQNTAAYALQMGGGIGTDFSTVRPNGAVVRRTGSVSTGVIPFMKMWDAMSNAMKSSGARRGAMMATLRCDHPDLLDFITVKHEPDTLTQFNLSVLVTDAFMNAIEDDDDWYLGFDVPRADGNHVGSIEKEDGTEWYIYEVLPARELWDMITESTYKYAEPGVIFIDRVNDMNNLKYCEKISCTNPCGEQPLPPYGACVLGYVNLAKMVNKPFTSDAHVDYERLERATCVGVRLLDNVIDVTQYPVREMEAESFNKRRIGLGVMGLANLLQMMSVRYGDDEAVLLTEEVMAAIRDAAYQASIELAQERGPFPLFERDEYLKGKFIQGLPAGHQDKIREHGIRNGVLLTIAPTGTTSLLFGNVSGGVEPPFALTYQRKVTRKDDQKEVFDVEDYGYRLYLDHCAENAIDPAPDNLPDYMVTSQDLTVDDHVIMLAACQEYIDASISKTINCPESMTFEDFQNVYMQAYNLGCKSCTTYRPCPETERVRGSVLSLKGETTSEPTILIDRPPTLAGFTYKIKWPLSEHAFYITINNYEMEDGTRVPHEIFINTKDTQHQEWIAALTRSLSAIFRRGGDISFVPQELKEVHSATGQGAWVGEGKKRYVPSLVALVGEVIEKHFTMFGIIADAEVGLGHLEGEPVAEVIGKPCPNCGSPTLIRQEGCGACLSCGYSNCG